MGHLVCHYARLNIGHRVTNETGIKITHLLTTSLTANLTHNCFSVGTTPDPQGSLRSKLWTLFSSFYSLKPRRATGDWPPANLIHNLMDFARRSGAEASDISENLGFRDRQHSIEPNHPIHKSSLRF
ncbi:hypothetical protein TRICI_006695 [Trichomonascus ciferrii]|uniref:Uncharacterized protein n=1 Tax=Trichomonascus ciferrii TaxID=44093 RepID=A0A642UEV8_9ASCO|nr:hypothetical protein TRICI_006695 [Trichomonascus ciferrii]